MKVYLGNDGGSLSDLSVGKSEMDELSLGNEHLWPSGGGGGEVDPPQTPPDYKGYAPGQMILTIVTTEANQKVNLGYNLGRWEGDTSASKYPTTGYITWDDGEKQIVFYGNEGIEETKENLLFHTYSTPGTHRITIDGVIKWNKVADGNNNETTPNSIRKVLTNIEILNGKNSPIYYIDEYAFSYCSLLESRSSTKIIPANLFNNCTEIKSFKHCFSHDTKFTIIPSGLFDKCTLVTNFWACFYDTSIQTIPENLFKNNINVTDFSLCFECTNITSIPAGLFRYNTKATDFSCCFQETDITSIPADLFKYNTKATDFSYCFAGRSYFDTTEIKQIPENLFATCTEITSFAACFMFTSILSIPVNLFAKCTKVTDFRGCFFGCSNFQSIPENLFKNNTKVKNFEECFDECTELTSIPQNLFANNKEVVIFNKTFNNCVNVEGKLPELWITHSFVKYHEGCFDCEKATNYAEAKAAGWAWG